MDLQFIFFNLFSLLMISPQWIIINLSVWIIYFIIFIFLCYWRWI